MVKIFVQILDKQDLPVGADIGIRIGEAVQNGKVSTDELSFAGAFPVQFVPQGFIHELFPEKRFFQAVQGRIAFALIFKVDRHDGMQGFNIKMPVDMGMQHGHVAETHDPLGMLHESAEVEPVDNADGAIASPGADDGPDGIIVEHPLHVGLALFVGAGKLGMGSVKVFPFHHVQSPGCEHPDGRRHLLPADLPGRGDDGDPVAFFKVWGCCHLFFHAKSAKLNKRSQNIAIN